jgi:hypothetical protein
MNTQGLAAAAGLFFTDDYPKDSSWAVHGTSRPKQIDPTAEFFL